MEIYVIKQKSTGEPVTITGCAAGSEDTLGVDWSLSPLRYADQVILSFHKEDDAKEVCESDGKPHWVQNSPTNPDHSMKGDLEYVKVKI